MARIIHTGQALVDVVVTVDSLPRRGQNAMAHTCARYAGGSVNILVAAARAGADAVLAGAHGTGPNGDLIRAALTTEHIAWHSVPVADADTGICFVMVEPSAERTFVTTQGAERRLSTEILGTSEPRPGDVVCVTGYSLALEATRNPLLDWLPTLPDDVIVVTDPGAAFVDLPDRVRETMLAHTDVWTSNLEEAQQLVGAELGIAAICERVAAHLPQDHAVVIVRDGDAGCAVRERGRTTVVEGFPQTPVDTNGAGDCHTGALLAEYVDHQDWPAAARWANAAAAIKVTRVGPATAPTRAEVDAFLASG